ncbi:hypothetical protein P3S68_016933 [Capsicum galapagoense]
MSQERDVRPEMSIFQIRLSHSKKYPKSEDAEAQSIEKKPRKSNRRESLAASEFSMGSPLDGSFTTYERIPAKHASGGEEVIILSKTLRAELEAMSISP